MEARRQDHSVRAGAERPAAFHDLLLSYRAAAGETPEDLAAALGVTPKAVKTWERPPGRPSARTPPADVFARLCSHFREKGVLPPGDYAAFAAARLARRRRRHGVSVPGRGTNAWWSRPALRATVPRRLTALVGREVLILEVCALLQEPDVALVTLTGAGGIGKTHLALEIAHRLRDAFAHGVWWVELAAVASPDAVGAAIAEQLGATEPSTLPPRDRLLARLAGQRGLLVLDNFEHVLAAAPLVSDLLAHCAGLTALVTSRAPLHLHGEQERPVPALEPAAASQLFVRRVRDLLPRFVRTAQNGLAIDAICARLDGVPLALELAAWQMRRFGTPEALFAALTPALPQLGGGPRDVPARQRTMRAAIAWSYALLSPEAQRLFRRLAVCQGGCTRAAACRLGEDLPDVEACLEALIEQGLVQQVAAPREARLTLFEVVREYGLEQLAAAGEEDAARRCHAEYYLALTEEAQAAFQTPQQARWDRLLVTERDNLRAALGWAIRSSAGPIALRLVVALWRHWERKGQMPEARRWLDGALAVAHDVPDDLRAQGLFAAAHIATAHNDDADAERWLAQCYPLALESGDRGLLCDVLNSWGSLVCRQGDYGRAVSLHEQALALAEAAGDGRGIAEAHHNLRIAYLLRWEPAEAEAHLEQAGASLRERGDVRGYALTRFGVGVTRSTVADWSGVLAAYHRGLTLARRLRDTDLLIYMVHGIAAAAGLTGDAEGAARLFGAAARLCAEAAVELPSSHRAIVEAAQGMVRGTLADPAAFDGWYAEGQQLSLEDTLALARHCVQDAQARVVTGEQAG